MNSNTKTIMMLKRYWYIKANREKWKDEKDPSHDHLDWVSASKHPAYAEGVLFDATSQLRDYFEQVQPDDIVVLHSTHVSNSNKKSKVRFLPRPRIVGIGKIIESIHKAPNRSGEWITVKIELIIPKPIVLREVRVYDNHILKLSEPYKLGTNRYCLTELKKIEYDEIKKMILEINPSSLIGVSQIDSTLP